MELIRVPRIMHDTSKGYLLRGRSIGFVPTMGALHEGHLSLVRRSKAENDITVVSIFVNPLQFGQSEDFQSYPRDTDRDKEKLSSAEADVLFMPDASQLYKEDFLTQIEVERLSDRLCGAFRPGHFRGVATVVAKLFNIVMPARAYFGQKDYQQSVIIKKMVKDLDMGIEVVVCPTIREQDGLAMSSRNSYLDDSERRAATVIYKCLTQTADMIKSGIMDIDHIRKSMHNRLSEDPLITEIQYASVYDPETLMELEQIKREGVIAVAVKMGRTRLIDNMLLKP